MLFTVCILCSNHLLANMTIGEPSNNDIFITGPGDGKYTCEVYGAPGVTATVKQRVITPDSYGSLMAEIKLNKSTYGEKKVVVQLRNSNFDIIEYMTLKFDSYSTYAYGTFKHKGKSGEGYYITIDSASCH